MIQLPLDDRYSKPLVYIMLKGNAFMYIGRGGSLVRPFSPTHHMSRMRQYCDRMEIVFCESTTHAIQVEAELIARYKPMANSRMPRLPGSTVHRFMKLGRFTDPSTGQWIA